MTRRELSITNSSISEIVYELGFEHSQSFSKLFKSKTDISPSEFRRSFKWKKSHLKTKNKSKYILECTIPFL